MLAAGRTITLLLLLRLLLAAVAGVAEVLSIKRAINHLAKERDALHLHNGGQIMLID